MADRFAGRTINFERANQSARVVWVDVRRSYGIDLGQSIVKRLLPNVCQFVFDFLPEWPVGGRAFEQTAQQALEIQGRAADEERLLAARADLGHRRCCRLDVLVNAVFLPGINDIDHVMRHG